MFSSSLVQNAQFLFIMQQDRGTHLRHTSKLLEPSVEGVIDSVLSKKASAMFFQASQDTAEKDWKAAQSCREALGCSHA